MKGLQQHDNAHAKGGIENCTAVDQIDEGTYPMSYKPIKNRRLTAVISHDHRLTTDISFVFRIFQRINWRLTAVNFPVNQT